MDKQRQRKLEARQRRQESLANAFPVEPKEPEPITVPKKKEHRETAATKARRNEGKPRRGRPPKTVKAVPVEVENKHTGKTSRNTNRRTK